MLVENDIDTGDLQRTFLSENRIFLEAVRKKLPLEEILLQYDKVKNLCDQIREKHERLQLSN